MVASPPSMLAARLMCCYATGRFRIEESTAPERRIMKAGSETHVEQCCNAQAAVDTEGSMMIPGCGVSR